MSNFEFYRKASESARVGYEMQAKRGTSFAGFRLFAKGINESLVKDRKEFETKKTEILTKYNAEYAREEIASLESALTTVINAKKETLHKIKDKLIADKRESIRRFTLEPPTDRQLRIIDSVSRRIESVSDYEWNMVVAEVSSNYQASAILHDLATKAGKDYKIPFEPESMEDGLNTLDKKLDKVIDLIDRDPYNTEGGYTVAEFFAHDPNKGTYGVLNLLCDEFDSVAPGCTPESIVELTDPADLTARLIDARGVAYQNKANDLFSEICRTDRSIRENGLNEENLNRAEQLIAMTNTLYPPKTGVENNG